MRRATIFLGYVSLLSLAAIATGCSGTNNSAPSPPAPMIIVSVSPATSSVGVNQTKQFSAVVTGTTNTAVNWSVDGGPANGSIAPSGLYTAPSNIPNPARITVRASSQASTTISGSAAITINPGNAFPQFGPVKLGTSGGNAKDLTSTVCCAGTLGSLVVRGGVQYILSNNHILAKSDTASMGDPISQPGIIEVNCDAARTSTVANLSKFFNLENDPVPNIDAAIAQVMPGKVDPTGSILYLGATATNGVPDPGPPNAGVGVAGTVNLAVAKSGRSTGLTCSTVIAAPVTFVVDYSATCGGPRKFSIQFTNQVAVAGGDFSSGGDSGALIVAQNTADPIALLFAGSDTESIGNPVSDVLNFFKSGTSDVKFVGGGPHPVIGCSLPAAPLSATAQAAMLQSAHGMARERLQRAVEARDLHQAEFLAHPAVQAVGVGASYDNPQEPAVLFFVTRGQPRSDLPAQVDGVRTRIVENDLFVRRGALNVEESGEMEQSVPPPQVVYSISDAEVTRATAVHTAHVANLMKWPGVQGVGIGSSVDSPGEAALMIFTVRGVAHDPIPPVIDGLRTRVRESSRFTAGLKSQAPHACSLPARKSSGTIQPK
jgi:hypothetical protein